MATTLQALRDRVHTLCGHALAEVGLLFRAVDEGGVAISPAVDDGIAEGIAAVGIPLVDGLEVGDADVANLSSFGVRRTLLHAQYKVLGLVDQQWYRAVRRHDGTALAPQPSSGGWLVEEREGIRRQLGRLRAVIAEPYREPSDPVVIANRAGLPGTVPPGACRPWPGDFWGAPWYP